MKTKDLSSVKSKAIRRFRDEILYGEIRGLIENLTGIELSTKIDVTSSRYDYTDYLLCHDDDIHDDQMENGRRIAFIYYLVPSEWNDSDGGLLDLFNVNGIYKYVFNLLVMKLYLKSNYRKSPAN